MITVTDQAHEWFLKELLLSPKDSIKIFGKYGGSTNVHVGVSTGILKAEPNQIAISVLKDEILYYVEETDFWFIDGYSLQIDLDGNTQEPIYNFSE